MTTLRAAVKAHPCAKSAARLPHARVCHTTPTGPERLPSEQISILSLAEQVSLAVPCYHCVRWPVVQQASTCSAVNSRLHNNDGMLHESLVLQTMKSCQAMYVHYLVAKPFVIKALKQSLSLLYGPVLEGLLLRQMNVCSNLL